MGAGPKMPTRQEEVLSLPFRRGGIEQTGGTPLTLDEVMGDPFSFQGSDACDTKQDPGVCVMNQ